MEVVISQLPQEVLESVFGFLDAPTLLTAQGVCRPWRKLLQSGAGERLWKAHVLREAQLVSSARVVVEEGVMSKRAGGAGNPVHAQLFWQAALAVMRTSKRPTTFLPHPNGEVTINEQEDALQVSTHTMEHYFRDRVVKADHPFPNFRSLPFYPTLVCTRRASQQHGPVFTLSWLSCCYFEVEMLRGEQGRRDCLGVGLTPRGYSDNRRQPGWGSGSFGYHSDDGNRFHGHGFGTEYGPPFGPGDTVGCGIVLGGRPRAFWTHNGKFLGIVDGEPEAPGVQFATLGVSLKGPVAFNFGTRPFKFDLLAREWADADDKERRSTMLRDLSWVRTLKAGANQGAEPQQESDSDYSYDDDEEEDDDDDDEGEDDDGDDEFESLDSDEERVRDVFLELGEARTQQLFAQGIDHALAYIAVAIRRRQDGSRSSGGSASSEEEEGEGEDEEEEQKEESQQGGKNGKNGKNT